MIYNWNYEKYLEIQKLEESLSRKGFFLNLDREKIERRRSQVAESMEREDKVKIKDLKGWAPGKNYYQINGARVFEFPVLENYQDYQRALQRKEKMEDCEKIQEQAQQMLNQGKRTRGKPNMGMLVNYLGAQEISQCTWRSWQHFSGHEYGWPREQSHTSAMSFWSHLGLGLLKLLADKIPRGDLDLWQKTARALDPCSFHLFFVQIELESWPELARTLKFWKAGNQRTLEDNLVDFYRILIWENLLQEKKPEMVEKMTRNLRQILDPKLVADWDYKQMMHYFEKTELMPKKKKLALALAQPWIQKMLEVGLMEYVPRKKISQFLWPSLGLVENNLPPCGPAPVQDHLEWLHHQNSYLDLHCQRGIQAHPCFRIYGEHYLIYLRFLDELDPRAPQNQAGLLFQELTKHQGLGLAPDLEALVPQDLEAQDPVDQEPESEESLWQKSLWPSISRGPEMKANFLELMAQRKLDDKEKNKSLRYQQMFKHFLLGLSFQFREHSFHIPQTRDSRGRRVLMNQVMNYQAFRLQRQFLALAHPMNVAQARHSLPGLNMDRAYEDQLEAHVPGLSTNDSWLSQLNSQRPWQVDLNQLGLAAKDFFAVVLLVREYHQYKALGSRALVPNFGCSLDAPGSVFQMIALLMQNPRLASRVSLKKMPDGQSATIYDTVLPQLRMEVQGWKELGQRYLGPQVWPREAQAIMDLLVQEEDLRKEHVDSQRLRFHQLQFSPPAWRREIEHWEFLIPQADQVSDSWKCFYLCMLWAWFQKNSPEDNHWDLILASKAILKIIAMTRAYNSSASSRVPAILVRLAEDFPGWKVGRRVAAFIDRFINHFQQKALPELETYKGLCEKLALQRRPLKLDLAGLRWTVCALEAQEFQFSLGRRTLRGLSFEGPALDERKIISSLAPNFTHLSDALILDLFNLEMDKWASQYFTIHDNVRAPIYLRTMILKNWRVAAMKFQKMDPLLHFLQQNGLDPKVLPEREIIQVDSDKILR